MNFRTHVGKAPQKPKSSQKQIFIAELLSQKELISQQYSCSSQS